MKQIKPLFVITIFIFIFQNLNAQENDLLNLKYPSQNTSNEIHRCATVEYNQDLIDQGIKSPDNQFEEWMKTRVTELRKLRSTDKSVGAIYTIPTIVHVIHRGEAEGTDTNIPKGNVDDQIEQLNRDFRRVIGTIGHNTHPDGADIEIEFCAALRDPDEVDLAQPGVNRVNAITSGLGAGVYSIAEFDDVVKRNTIWNPDEYFNFWSADLGGGVILGYAQFPEAPGLAGVGTGNGDPETDGVVCLFSTVGGDSINAPNTPYHLGRTGTHEVGHWLGLRHIWGDGDCTVDDFVDDTPNAADSNGNCPNPKPNSCDDSSNPHFAPNDPLDQMENYMDYSSDVCFNMFTNGQSDRMRIVMGDTGMGSPRREILNSSTKCSPRMPWISFLDEESEVDEASNCSTPTTISIPLKIALDPGTASTVTFDYTASTASNLDYTVTNTVTFPAGSTAQQNLEIDITPDGVVELAEEIVITITSVSGGGILNSFNLTHIVRISDDDRIPSEAAFNNNVNILTADFEDPSDDSDWTMVSPIPSGNNWIFSTVTGSTGNTTRTAHISDNGTTFTYDQNVNSRTIIFQDIDLTEFVDVSVTFDWACVGESTDAIYDYGTVVYSLDGVTFLTIPGTPLLHTQPNMITATYNLPDFLEGNVVKIGFAWFNDGMTGTTPIAIDNVSIDGDQITAAEIRAALSGVTSLVIEAFQTVHFYDPVDGEVMLTILNGSQSLGCTDVSVVVAAGGTLHDMSSVSANKEATSKIFKIEPSTNSNTADYTVELYYSDAEINHWINNHGQTVTEDNLYVFSTTATSMTAVTSGNTMNGANQYYYSYTDITPAGYIYSADFVGDFGLYGGADANACDFSDDYTHTFLDPGKTSVEDNATVDNVTTLVGSDYEITGGVSVQLQNNTEVPLGSTAHIYIEPCEVLSQSNFRNEVPDVKSYYRERFKEQFGVIANPDNRSSSIIFNNRNSGDLEITLIDNNGEIVKTIMSSKKLDIGLQSIDFNTEELSQGHYMILFSDDNDSWVGKFTHIR